MKNLIFTIFILATISQTKAQYIENAEIATPKLGGEEYRAAVALNEMRVLDSSASFEWFDNNWENTGRSRYEYYESGLVASETRLALLQDRWDFVARTLSFYNSEEQLDSILIQNWSQSEEKWIKGYKVIYEYNLAGYLTNETKYQYKFGGWNNFKRYVYSPDENGVNLIEIEQLWKNGAWTYYLQYQRTLEGEKLKKTNSYRWSEDDEAWEKLGKYEYAYYEDGKTQKVVEYKRIEDFWIEYGLTEYMYENGLNNHTLVYVWDSENQKWQNWRRLFFTYDAYGETVEYVNDNFAQGEWRHNYRVLYHYRNFSSVADESDAGMFSVVDADDYIEIQTRDAAADGFALRVYDLRGGQAPAQYFISRCRIDKKALGAGVYFITISRDGEIVFSRSFMAR